MYMEKLLKKSVCEIDNCIFCTQYHPLNLLCTFFFNLLLLNCFFHILKKLFVNVLFNFLIFVLFFLI